MDAEKKVTMCTTGGFLYLSPEDDRNTKRYEKLQPSQQIDKLSPGLGMCAKILNCLGDGQ